MKFTYYTIIGRDPVLINNHLKNIKFHAGFDKLECEKEIIVIAFKNKNIPEEITNQILDICKKYEVRAEIFNEKTDNFILNLYDCWNLGYELSDDGFVFRAGSDQIFNKDSFVNLNYIANREYKINPKTILQAQTIESELALNKIKAKSRHLTADFGTSFNNLEIEKFENYCKNINEGVEKDILTIKECLKIWKHPTSFKSSLGRINRTDGCSWLMTKEDWIKFGPLPPKELCGKIIKYTTTGDVIIHDRFQKAGYRNFLVRDCITYHFVRGESKALQ